jgi:hypothetical protein
VAGGGVVLRLRRNGGFEERRPHTPKAGVREIDRTVQDRDPNPGIALGQRPQALEGNGEI